ncbi:MAG: L-threonylcarbamoyladenylate synthase, partial [Kiloniellales bacterium]|nr:L-threonylcarbamoyladenylate synthase [Kiloniellales bacterium]
AAYEEAALIIREGGVVAFPTETVYGLGADATNDTAVAGIFAAKDRPQFNPIIVHLLSLEEAEKFVLVNEKARLAAVAFWPGPLTLVLPKRKNCPVSLLCSAGLETLAVRVPRHPVGRALLEAVAVPLAAPSANASGRVSPTTAEHVAQSLGSRVPLILDGGACEVGLESTVMDFTGENPRLLRPGGIPEEELTSILGSIDRTAESKNHTRPKASPGLLESHYAPLPPLRLNVTKVEEGEVLIAFGRVVPEGATEMVNLSVTENLEEAAANLFSALRKFDRCDVKGIAVMPIPDRGLGAAICDRLERAAAPRPGVKELGEGRP